MRKGLLGLLISNFLFGCGSSSSDKPILFLNDVRFNVDVLIYSQENKLLLRERFADTNGDENVDMYLLEYLFCFEKSCAYASSTHADIISCLAKGNLPKEIPYSPDEGGKTNIKKIRLEIMDNTTQLRINKKYASLNLSPIIMR